MLPYPQHLPTSIAQHPIDLLMALHIAIELRSPIPIVRLRRGPVVGAAVPEASVHEDRKPVTREHNVWPDLKVARLDKEVLAEAESFSVEKGEQVRAEMGVTSPTRPLARRHLYFDPCRIFGHRWVRSALSSP